jgi:hypothetical protein
MYVISKRQRCDIHGIPHACLRIGRPFQSLCSIRASPLACKKLGERKSARGYWSMQSGVQTRSHVHSFGTERIMVLHVVFPEPVACAQKRTDRLDRRLLLVEFQPDLGDGVDLEDVVHHPQLV